MEQKADNVTYTENASDSQDDPLLAALNISGVLGTKMGHYDKKNLWARYKCVLHKMSLIGWKLCKHFESLQVFTQML